MVTTKKKPVVDIQKIKRKGSKCTTTKKSSNHKGRQQEWKKRKEKQLQSSQKTMNKITKVRPYLSKTTLKVSRLNSPIK